MAIVGGVDLGNLPNYLFFFDNGSKDANWQGATKGYVGDVAVNGLVASERTSGSVPYAGTIYTNAPTLGAWQQIVNQNPTQASGVTGANAIIAGLETDLISAFHQINALPATPGFESINSSALDGLNTQNGIPETFVINVTSGFQVSSQIDITGDAGDVYILRWDTDANFSNGYQGQVKFQSGGAIVPHGGLTPASFINVAGDINSSGGGTTPPPPYPQGPRLNNGTGALIVGGQDFSGGGFFTGYWLTTGAPTTFDPVSGLWVGETQPLSNGIFVGGWYTLTTKFSMTSGTSGVHVAPTFIPNPKIKVQKLVSADNGATFQDADVPPGPNIPSGTNPIFKYIVTNIGNVTLNNVTLSDDKLGPITLPVTTLIPNQSVTVLVTGTWQAGPRNNLATTTGQYNNLTVSDFNPANYVGTTTTPALKVIKYVSPDNGVTFFDADVAPGPTILEGTNPVFKYVITNSGGTTVTDITLVDNIYPDVSSPVTSLAPGASATLTITENWGPSAGQHTNVATVNGKSGTTPLSDSNPANYFAQSGAPAIQLTKLISVDGGITYQDANVEPFPVAIEGTIPKFKFIIKNTGNVTLSPITLSDTVLGPIPAADLPSSLAPGESFTTPVINGVPPAQPIGGPYTNTATVTGHFDNRDVTAEDVANYYVAASSPAISLIKYVSPDNGITFDDADTPPGPGIIQGINPIYRYVVKNTGNITLTDITLVDLINSTPPPVSVTTPVTTLIPGGSFTVEVTRPWQSGDVHNDATVTGKYTLPDGTTDTVDDSNPANYHGIPAVPGISIRKLVSGDGGITYEEADVPPGPSIPQNIAPKFEYIVTNTGNVTLTNLTLTDNKLGPITVPVTFLEPGHSYTVNVTGTWHVGLQTNEATATGQFDNLPPVSDKNPANYTGIAVPAIKVIKQVSPDGINFFDADVPPGPNIPEGTNPTYKYTVTNIGNVTLDGITLVDVPLGNIPVPVTTLNPGGSFTVTKTVGWLPGLQHNNVTVTGHYQGQPVTDENPANYTGVPARPAIDVEKLISADGGHNFVDADTPPGPNIPQGITPIFRFIVRNTGNTVLTNITLVDTVLGPITIPSTTLGIGGSFFVDVPGVWSIGQHENKATVTGRYDGIPVSDSDFAHYVGVLTPRHFKQFSVDETVTIPEQKPNCEDVMSALVDVEIIETRVINTMIGTSVEGQTMTGYKLIIEGILHQKIEYIADEPTQTVHAAEFKVPFSTFIILPEDYTEDSRVTVEAEVEDVFVKQLTKRKIFKNVTLRVEAFIDYC